MFIFHNNPKVPLDVQNPNGYRPKTHSSLTAGRFPLLESQRPAWATLTFKKKRVDFINWSSAYVQHSGRKLELYCTILYVVQCIVIPCTWIKTKSKIAKNYTYCKILEFIVDWTNTAGL